MTSKGKSKASKVQVDDNAGELLVAWQKYSAISPDELTLNEGDVVELVDTEDPSIYGAKRIKLDPELDVGGEKLLDNSAARHKLSVKPKRTRASSRHSPTRTALNARWLVRQVKGDKKQGWVPCQILQTVDDPQPGTGLPGDAAFRRQAVVKELVETEQEFVRDLDFVVQKYLIGSEKEPRKPKIIKDNFELIFGNLKEISEFHRTVLMEGVKYYANEPHLLGKAFLRLERDFDKHVNYCKEEPLAQSFLDTSDVARDYFEELSHRISDDKTISEHLKLPIQRINDYQLLLKELVRYSACLGEDNTDLQKALELMLSIPHRAQDDKFTNSIEGYRGSIHKLGRLLAHDWFSVCFGDITKERYLFLFKARILISKVRRISDDRSVFQLKDIIRLPQVEIKDYPEDAFVFDLIDKTAGNTLTLTAHREQVKEFWLKEIKEFASEAEESTADDFQVVSQPTSPPEPVQPQFQLPKQPQKKDNPKVEVTKPVEINKSEEKVKSTPVTKEIIIPIETPKVVEDRKPVEVKKPVEAPKPVEVTKPAEASKPVEAPKPAASPKTVEAPKPVEAAKAVEVKTPKVSEAPKPVVQDSKKPEEKENPKVEINTKLANAEPLKTETPKAAEVDKVNEISNSSQQPIVHNIKTIGKPGDIKYPSPTPKKDTTNSKLVNPTLSATHVNVVGADHHSSHCVLTRDGSKTEISDYGDSYRVTVEVGLNVVEEDMSKKHISAYGSTEGGYGESSSYTRRSVNKTSYSSDAGLTSSRYGTESTSSSKYGTAESSIGSKYGANRSLSMTTDSDSKYESKYGDSGYSRRSIAETGEGDSHSYSRRSISKIIGEDDGEDYNFSRRSIKGRSSSALKNSYDIDDESSYTTKRRAERLSRMSIDEDVDADSYISKIKSRNTETEVGSYKRTTSTDSNERSYKRTTSTDSNEGSYKRSTSIVSQGEEEDRLAKFEKYSRRTSTDLSEKSESRESKYKRTDSKTDTNEHDSFLTKTEKTVFDHKILKDAADTATIQAQLRGKKDIGMAPPDETPKFTKTLGGTHIKPGERTNLEIALADTPDSLTWLKDNRAIDGDLITRIKITSLNEHKTWKLEIDNAKQEDSGVFTAVACNAKGKSTCSTHLWVHTLTPEEQEELKKPDFVIKLKDTELLEDTYLRFMLKVKGDPHPTLTFFKDGVKLAEKSDRVSINRDHSETDFYELVIPEVKKIDAGVYKCIAKNEHGEASTEAIVTVTESKHLFDDIPDKDTLLPKGEKPTFIWKKDGDDFDVDERFKVLMGDDEDSLALIFQHVKPEDAGLYTCVAQTTTGHISCSAELTVQGTVHELYREPEKPTLIIEKREALANTGGTCIMELQVKGFPKPKISFSHEGKPVEASQKYKFMYEDDETMSLVIKNVEASDAGKYEITAENELGQDIREMNLIVKAPPVLTKMVDTTASTEQELKMSVNVDGIPKPTIQFYKNGKVIKNTDLIKVIEEDKKHSIVIKNTTLSDSGSFSVVAINEMAQVSEFWNLEIYCKPKITKKLGKNIEIHQQKEVELSVKMESEPAPEVVWYKDGQEITSDSHVTISNRDDTYKLVISGTVTTDSASYKCKAKNIHGTVEDEVRVDVKRAPTIVTGLEAMTVTEHDTNVTLKLKVDAFPKPTVKWYLDEMEIKETRTEFTRSEADDGIKLVIKEVASELAGQYTCKVINECGDTSTSAKLTVNCKPRITKQLRDTTVDEGATLHLEVEVEAVPEPTVKWLRNGREVSSDARIKISRDTQRQESYNLTVNLIKYEEQGEYEVQVTNALGTVSSKSVVTVHKMTHTDAVEVHEEPPTQFTVHVVEDEDEEQVAKIADRMTIEEIIEEEPQHPEETELLQSDTSKGKLFEKMDVLNKDPVCSDNEAEPVISTNNIDEKLKAKITSNVDIESMEIVEVDKDDVELFPTESKLDISSKKAQTRKGSRGNLESLNLVDVAVAEKILIEDGASNKKNKLRKGSSCTIESLEHMQIMHDINEKMPIEEDMSISKPQLRKGSKFNIESLDIVEVNEECNKQFSIEDRSNQNSKPRKGSASTIEALKLIELEQEKGKSLIENISKNNIIDNGVLCDVMEETNSTEALPQILEKTMNDCSQFESLGVSYMVKGTGNPMPTAKWTLNGNEIKPGSNQRFNITQEGEYFKMDIVRLSPKDAGVIECCISNCMGEVKQQAKLEIIPEAELRRPKIKEGQGLQNQDVLKKKTAILKTIIVGDPVPDVTWCFNGKEITASEYEKYKMVLNTENKEMENGLQECTFSLTIPKTERINGGKYTIKAKNKWGVIESSAVLNIVLAPEIVGPDYVKVVPGDATELTCIIQSNPKAIVTWTKSENVIESSGDIEIIEDLANEKYTLKFNKVQLSDEGYYKVYAKNEYGEADSEGRIKTIKDPEPSTEKPKFITGLTEAHVEHGGEISLMVRADGLPIPDIKWFLNNKEIVEAPELQFAPTSDRQITSTMTITNYAEKDAGIYKVTATNVVGEAETSAKINMLQTPPSFAKRLERTQEVNEGEPLELKAKVTGSPKPQVAWFKDGEPIDADDKRIKTVLLPDGTVKLNIDKITPADSGAYKLVVKNPNGETAGLCAVVVNANPQRPKFMKCIKDTKAMTGEPLKLVAKVSGHPPPEIKWLKDGLPVRASSNIHLEHHPDGTVALVVDNVRPENAGKYTLIVSNKMGDVTGDAMVEIEKKPLKPEFITRIFPQTVVEGFPVKFEVKVTGFPEPTISWIRNGAEVISDGNHIKVTDLPDGCSALVIEACNANRDAIIYTVVAKNEAGEAESSALLTVTSANRGDQPEERPMFLHDLRDVITDEGQQLKLEAPFTGNPIPSVQWTKDGQPIVPSERILLTCDGKKVGLCIDTSLPSDAGYYGVTINNPLGSETSGAKASVHKVFQPPSFTQRFTDLQQLPNRDAKFPVRVSGVPQPEVSWSKDGQPLRDTDKYRIKRDGDACCLYIANCQPEDEGSYTATASNKEGTDICMGRLEVVKEIKSPKKIEPANFVKRIGDTELYKGMTAKFTACAAGIPEPSVEWYRNDQRMYPSDRIRMEMDRNGLLRLTIAGVDQDDIGKYSCKIYNDHGSDICHANLRFDEGMESKPKRPMIDQYTEYDKYKKSGAPMPLSDPPIISRMTDRHCTLSWKPSIPSGPRTPVTYQLEMLEMPNGDWFTVRSGIRSCCCDVRNLEPFRDYKFRVRVENKYGISDPSPYAVTHRQKLEPDAPKFIPYLSPGIDFRPETSPYFPKDFDIDRPPHDNMSQAPRFLRQEHDAQYGVKEHNTNLFWFVYGYPKPKMSYYFNDELIESGGRFDTSYTRNGQATLFINKMLERDVGCYEAVAVNEHGEARQRVRLEIAEPPTFLRRPNIEYVMVRGKARFEARILGVPYPEIKWYKDWKPVASSSRIKIQFMEPDTAILLINDCISKDEGLYSVSARNVAGSISASAMLHVEENDLEYNIRTYNNPTPIKLRKKPYSDAYDLGDELGRGTQGITYHAVERLNGRNYAAKVMYGRGDLRPMMYNEWEIMNQLHHRRLISLHDAYEHEDCLALIIELAGGGELVKDHLLKQEYYTESHIAGFIRQLLEGLQYMHERGIGHMGLDIGDLLLSHPGSDELKITDFGLSRRIQMGKLYPLKYGMPEYVSPESANGEGTGLGHDMWSVGIITYILLSGRSPFRGAHDMETLQNIQSGKWMFEESWWSRMSLESRDFITKLLVYQADGRLDVHAALRHPWLERSDKIWQDEYRIETTYLRDYFMLYREWYDNASCKRWFRRRPLEGAFTHPSRMVYPPGERYTPPPGVEAPEKIKRKPKTWEDQLPSRSPLNYEIGAFKSESHYQNGPDTYLLQLRDVDFPVRLREYMKVAGSRGAGFAHIISNENGYDWETPVIRERRRFTDVMDEEIDDERKTRINKYGTGDAGYTIRRLRHEIGTRLDTYAEAEAFLESKMDGRLPFFRETPQMCAMQEGKDLELTCMAVGDPTPIVQWFKNDGIIAESHRIKIEIDSCGRSHLKLCPALSFDAGMYKVVARNKIGQTLSRTRIVFGQVPDAPDSPEGSQVSDTEVLLTWKQPKHDGHSPVICYSVQYKLADDMEWIDQAKNIDHEFYLMRNLESGKNYIFRLAAKNLIGWSDQGVASSVIMTQPTGSPKVQMSKAMKHLQQITDSGTDVHVEPRNTLDYSIETTPIEWLTGDPQQKYNFISELSRGKFSSVVKAVDKEADQVVVAKAIDIRSQGNENVEGEFAALRSLRHERIGTLFAAYKSGDGLSATFIMEKLQGADVLTYLASRHEYTEQTVATIVTQVLDGLQYLHWRGLCHLDLQPDNIVMRGVRAVEVKLVDLGCAHRVTKLGNRVPIVGHPDYIAPEVLNDEPAIPQTDIWSLGVLIYVMLSGTLPFKGVDANESRQNILFARYRFEHLYKEVSQEGVRFVMLLFKRHPNKRPTAEECHENRWMLPTDSMIKKRERAVFLGNRLKEYSEQYHAEKTETACQDVTALGGRSMLRSHSIQEELLTAP